MSVEGLVCGKSQDIIFINAAIIINITISSSEKKTSESFVGKSLKVMHIYIFVHIQSGLVAAL